MAVERINWVGDRIHVERRLEELDGYRETDIFYPEELLDIVGWAIQKQNREKIFYLAALEHRREEQVS